MPNERVFKRCKRKRCQKLYVYHALACPYCGGKRYEVVEIVPESEVKNAR